MLGGTFDRAPLRRYLMLERLLPQSLDNTYRGHVLALWLFGLIAFMKGLQSVSIMFAGQSTASGADGIPLATFPPAIAQTVLSVFAQGSVWRLTFCLLCFVVLARYRRAVPLMLLFFVLNYLAAQAMLYVVPLVRVGTPVGPVVNLVLFSLMVVALALSLWPRTSKQQPRTLLPRGAA
jgi:hypothetical protein